MCCYLFIGHRHTRYTAQTGAHTERETHRNTNEAIDQIQMAVATNHDHCIRFRIPISTDSSSSSNSSSLGLSLVSILVSSVPVFVVAAAFSPC